MGLSRKTAVALKKKSFKKMSIFRSSMSACQGGKQPERSGMEAVVRQGGGHGNGWGWGQFALCFWDIFLALMCVYTEEPVKPFTALPSLLQHGHGGSAALNTTAEPKTSEAAPTCIKATFEGGKRSLRVSARLTDMLNQQRLKSLLCNSCFGSV